MANMSVFDVSGGSVSIAEDSAISAAAAVQTIPPGKDARMALRISNGSETAAQVILKAGDGPRAVLGDKNVTVASGQTAYIALFDSARFKRFSDGAMSVELAAIGGSALTVQQLESITIEAVQL